MSLNRQKDISRTKAQSCSSSSSPNTSCLPSNNNKTHDNGHLQSSNMSSENLSLLTRLKVRFTFVLFF